MTLLSAWEKSQDIIKERIGEASYTTWFSAIRVKENPPATLAIETPDEFFKNWIVEHYQKVIQEALNHAAQRPVEIAFTVNPDLFTKDTQSRFEELKKGFPEADKRGGHLNPLFSFENFVIGPSNRFAAAACLAVAESPAKAYNPLFLYGGVGLGKTHLLQAITLRLQKSSPRRNFFYTTSESFTNELINAIRHRSTQEFRKRFRNIDVLLIDDIHFIAGKESTQEEFFHTFNALHNSHKQIIISSDRPPKEISNLEERLSSRFAWGLIADVQPPDFETRVAILQKKVERESIKVPMDVVLFIAQEIKSNIRELEGALIRVIAYSLLEERPVSLAEAKFILKDMVKETLKSVSVDVIQKNVASFFNISLADLKTKRRNRNIVLPRQIAMYLSRQLTPLSFPEIGTAFGGKDHTTVLHSWKKINKESQENQELKHTLEKLTTAIKQ